MGFLDSLYQDVFQRSVDSSGRSTFGDQLAGHVSRKSVADQIFDSPEYSLDLVRSMYSRYLDRDLDPVGRGHWPGLKNSGATDEQVLALILSEPFIHEFYDKTLP